MFAINDQKLLQVKKVTMQIVNTNELVTQQRCQNRNIIKKYLLMFT